MHRKYLFIFFAAVAALLMTSATASAQLSRLTGQVMLKQADGTMAPVDKAVVEIYRTDRGGNKETKTDKKGNFILVLDVAGDYVLSVSAPNAQPHILRVKVREEAYKISLEPGDGRRLTKDEVLASANGASIPASTPTATAGTAGATATPAATAPAESEDSKTKRAEIERKNAEIAKSNKKVEESNAIVIRTYKAGNDALRAKRYDEAITLYDEGLAADPEQSALMTNKAFALTQRGVERYNTAKDDAAREAAKKDFKDAADAGKKAYDLVNAEPVGADVAEKNRHTLAKNLAIFAKAEAMRLFVTKVDTSQLDAGVAAYDEYVGILTEPAKKLEAQLTGAKMMLDGGKPDLAAAAYQKILEGNPDNVDALRGAGIALFSTGDKAKYQEAANYLQRFVDKAPDTHPDKKDVQAILGEMKKENVTPQKNAGGRRRS